MADPLLALHRAFEAAITAAFGAEHASTDPAIRRSQSGLMRDMDFVADLLYGRSAKSVAHVA